MSVLALPRQVSLDELGVPLREITFVVVDLETTGGSPATAEITEIGAVKVRGGEVVGELATLVDPGGPIPPFITVLTGITDAMVAAAPRIASVLPTFLEWLGQDAVLVAHNAPFDVGFLKAAAAAAGLDWPAVSVLDTARLARRVLTRDEAPDCKLSTLARLFRAATPPCHRALDDARATVDVLHGLFDRLGGLGVQSWEELRTFSAQVSAAQRRKRHLADGLPAAPGVYLFRAADERVLYVGQSKDLRSRVRQYFLASEPRTRMAEMVGLAERVDSVVCAHPLEAEVRELRLIAEHKPRYNRRSRFPERALYLKLTAERYPRLSVVRAVADDGATYLGPFGSRERAELAMAALHDAFPLRRCSLRLSPRRRTPACALAGMGRCGAPCEGRITPEAYAVHVAAARAAMTGDPRPVVTAASARLARLAAQQRFEEAAAQRDRLRAFVRAAARCQELAALAAVRLVAAAPRPDGGYDLASVHHGRLVAAGVVPAGAVPAPYLHALRATAETVPAPGTGPTPLASAEEMECIARWLQTPGTRLVDVQGCWTLPAWGAAGMAEWLGERRDGDPLAAVEDRRRLRPAHRPARAAV